MLCNVYAVDGIMDEKHIEQGIIRLLQKAQTELPQDVVKALQQAAQQETGIAQLQLETMLKNITSAKKTQQPLCQDTGIQTFFITVGTEFPAIGRLQELIVHALDSATRTIPLRPNAVDPVTGKNHGHLQGENNPHIIWDFIQGDDVHITVLPKGSGSENMNALGMLSPSMGMDGVKDFVVQKVIQAGGNPCPPTIIGVGIGGSADLALILGKRALLRPVGQRHHNPAVAKIEEELIDRINQSGIGPMGLGGKTTVLDVHLETTNRHPASLPVGLVVQCWSDRRASMVIHADGSWDVK